MGIPCIKARVCVHTKGAFLSAVLEQKELQAEAV
jgi:hypothetical protein